MPRQLNALMVPSLRKAFFEGGSFPDGDHAFDDHADHKNDSPVSSVIGPAVPDKIPGHPEHNGDPYRHAYGHPSRAQLVDDHSLI